MSNSIPLPCPFCGCERVCVCETEFDINKRKAYAISCCAPECHGAIWALGHGYFKTEKEAITAWNTRFTTKHIESEEMLLEEVMSSIWEALIPFNHAISNDSVKMAAKAAIQAWQQQGGKDDE